MESCATGPPGALHAPHGYLCWFKQEHPYLPNNSIWECHSRYQALNHLITPYVSMQSMFDSRPDVDSGSIFKTSCLDCQRIADFGKRGETRSRQCPRADLLWTFLDLRYLIFASYQLCGRIDR